MKVSNMIFALYFLILISCAQVNYPSATTGSKADAIVVITYEYSNGVNPDNWVEEWEGIDASASERCQNWGYSDAVKFDQGKRWCMVYSPYGGCVYWQENLHYQCIDKETENSTSQTID